MYDFYTLSDFNGNHIINNNFTIPIIDFIISTNNWKYDNTINKHNIMDIELFTEIYCAIYHDKYSEKEWIIVSKHKNNQYIYFHAFAVNNDFEYGYGSLLCSNDDNIIWNSLNNEVKDYIIKKCHLNNI